MGSRKQQRIAVTTQLVTGEDDDLVEWFQCVTGSRNQAVKDALRAALDSPIPTHQDAASAVEIAELRDQMAELRDQMAEMQDQMAAWGKWFETDFHGYLRAQLDTIGTLPEVPTIEAAPQVESEDLDRRAKKLKRQAW